MYKQGFKLMSPFDYDNAMYFGSQVKVMRDGKVIDQGVILSHHDDVLQFRHNTYAISEFEFLVVFTPPDFPRM